MRHDQQLELIEKFKSECKAKGYAQPLGTLQTGNVDNYKSLSAERRKRAIIRWVRSSDPSENATLADIAMFEQEFVESHISDDNFEGTFHEPATLPNDYLEAICGNLTLT